MKCGRPQRLFGLRAEYCSESSEASGRDECVRLQLGQLCAIETVDRLWYESMHKGIGGAPDYRAWIANGGRRILFEYADGGRYVISSDGSQVWAQWPQGSTEDDAMCCVLGPMMGIVLYLRGTPALHGSAVVIDGEAVVLIGESGAGKSTTAAAFAQLGYPVLTEDIVALTEGDRLHVQPGYPLIRLWPHAVGILFGDRDALPRLTPTWDKRYLDLTQPGYVFRDLPARLGAVYVLGNREETNTCIFETLSPQAQLVHLVANAYTVHVGSPKVPRVHEFRAFSKVASGCLVASAHPPKDPMRVYDLCEAIAAHFREHHGSKN